MKFATLTVVSLVSLAAPVLAQDAENATAQPPADAANVQKAESTILESAKVYAAAKAMTDVISFHDGTQTQTMNVSLQGADRVRIALDDITFTVIGGSLYAERKDIADMYAQMPAEGGLGEALSNTIGFAPPHIIARSSTDVAELVEAWTFGMLPMAKLSGHAMGKTEAGNESHDLTLSSPAGRGTIRIDAKTMLMDQVKVVLAMEGSPEMTMTLSYAPKVEESLSPALEFVGGDRKKVSAIEDLKVDLTGKPAPDFSLESIEGGKVTLSELKGNVVVLDFWATWCVPCKRALPSVSEFAQWAKDNNKPVKVFGVDVWERGSIDEVRKAVTEYWTASKFVMPTLFDFDGAVAKKFAFDAIPTTMIIAPDGKIFAVHTGAGDDVIEILKKDVEGAIASVQD